MSTASAMSASMAPKVMDARSLPSGMRACEIQV